MMKAIILIVLSLAGQTALWLLWRQQDPLISEENRVMENVQVLLMLAGMMGFIWVAMRSQPFPRRTGCKSSFERTATAPAPFPLTPALSLREREQAGPSSDDNDPLAFASQRTKHPPLPRERVGVRGNAMGDDTVAKNRVASRRTLFGSLALFYATFIILEVDTRAFNAPWFNWCFNGAVRDLWLGGLWVIAGGCFFRFWRDTWRLFTEWVASLAGVCLLAAGGFWLASGACDKVRFFPGSHHFVEELLEVNAGILMLLCAVLTLRRGAVKTGACHSPGAGVNEDRQSVTTDQQP